MKNFTQLYDEEPKNSLPTAILPVPVRIATMKKPMVTSVKNAVHACSYRPDKSEICVSGNPPVMKETKHWYLPLDKYEAWLRKWILE